MQHSDTLEIIETRLGTVEVVFDDGTNEFSCLFGKIEPDPKWIAFLLDTRGRELMALKTMEGETKDAAIAALGTETAVELMERLGRS